MADVLTGKTEIASVSMDLISNLMQSFLIEKAQFLGKVTDYSKLAVKGVKTIAIPKADGFSVSDKAENVSADATTVIFGSDVISLNKHKYIQFLLEDFADAQSQVAVVQAYLERMAKALALQMDKDIIAQLQLAAAGNGFALAGATLARTDILEARRIMRAAFLDPAECFLAINEDREKEILDIDEFIDASKFGSNEPISNGVIGKVYGLKVMVSTEVDPDYSLIWHPSAVGFGTQMGLRFQKEYDLKELAWRHSSDMLYGVKVLDGGKRQAVAGTVI